MVGIVHFFVISSFLDFSKASNFSIQKKSQTSQAIIPFSVVILQPTALPGFVPIQSKLETQPFNIPGNALARNNFKPNRQFQKSTLDQSASTILNRNMFLNLEDLDEAAAHSESFEQALLKAMPAQYNSLLLEFLIDETGSVVEVSCIEGDCLDVINEQMQQLTGQSFVPALKNGQAVASRKVIQISPLPTSGF